MIIRRLSAIVAAALAVGLAAGCSSAEQRGPQAPPQPPPAELQSFYDQQLAWGPCTTFTVDPDKKDTFADAAYDCAAMTVPLNYTNPTGRTAQIGVLRKKAADPARRVGSLVVNPGGPGGSGMEFVPGLAAMIGTGELAQRFDLVGFDPRGVGASTPAVICFTATERDAMRSAEDEPTVEAARAVAEGCGARTDHEVLANVGTREVAKDLDVLRAALGDQRLTFLGFSYGTRIGTAYAEAFPGNVRALVLDGAMDPNKSGSDELTSGWSAFDRAITAFVVDCTRHADCPLGTDRADAAAKLETILESLEKTPAVTRDIRRSLTAGDAGQAVISSMYRPAQAWPRLRTALAALQTGDGDPMLAIADRASDRRPDGSYNHDRDADLAVMCADTPRPASGDEGAETDECTYWPVAATGTLHEARSDGLPQVLVVSTTGDPATPYRNGVNLAKQLDAQLLTATGTIHTASFGGGSSCVDDAVTRYLVDLTLPADGTKCDLVTPRS